VIQGSSEHPVPKADCGYCHAGRTLSFSWELAKAGRLPDKRRDLGVFIEPQPLRHGTLYKCRHCGQPWYLFGRPEMMNVVPRDRLPVIHRWNESPILLPPGIVRKLEKIGRTPPDRFGNGSGFHETPCSVTTLDGKQQDLAVVSMQRHAPFERWRQYHVATEIAEVHPSRHALPLPVRVATSQSDEVRMGFYPTLVELPDGELTILNGTQHFLVKESCDSSKVALSRRPLDMERLPPILPLPSGIIYFIADGPGAP
jgi:hypothetical protein